MYSRHQWKIGHSMTFRDSGGQRATQFLYLAGRCTHGHTILEWFAIRTSEFRASLNYDLLAILTLQACQQLVMFNGGTYWSHRLQPPSG
jgi:hypothetical protein